MNKTKQLINTATPPNNARALGLAVYCGDCQTMRVFKIHETLDTLQKREICGVGFDVTCEKCGHRIGIGVEWIDGNPPYSYTETPSNKMQEKTEIIIEDPDGLK